MRGFSEEFLAGMAADASRSRRLGDVGANAPSEWLWGGRPDCVPHVLVMLYAREGGLEAWAEAVKGADWDAAFSIQTRLDTFDMGEIEPFGFADGLSQPQLDWRRALDPGRQGAGRIRQRGRSGRDRARLPQRVRRYTERPLIDPSADRRALDLPPAEDAPNRRDLGRNGSYLVFRQLHQDVRGFWQFLDRQANAVPARALAPGRGHGRPRPVGAPLVPLHDPIEGVGPALEDIASNHFTYASDPTACAARSAPMSGAPTRAPAICPPGRGP